MTMDSESNAKNNYVRNIASKSPSGDFEAMLRT